MAYWGQITCGILGTLRDLKQPLTRHEIMEHFAKHDVYPDDATLAVTLSELARDGVIENAGREPCGTCGARRTKYRLLDKGRIRMGDALAFFSEAG